MFQELAALLCQMTVTASYCTRALLLKSIDFCDISKCYVSNLRMRCSPPRDPWMQSRVGKYGVTPTMCDTSSKLQGAVKLGGYFVSFQLSMTLPIHFAVSTEDWSLLGCDTVSIGPWWGLWPWTRGHHVPSKPRQTLTQRRCKIPAGALGHIPKEFNPQPRHKVSVCSVRFSYRQRPCL